MPQSRLENGMPNPADAPAHTMADYLQKLFKVADSNDDGVLSPIDFAELLTRLNLDFPDHVILSLVDAADVNGDGVIDYKAFEPAMIGLMEAVNGHDEFLPAMLDVIAAMKEGHEQNERDSALANCVGSTVQIQRVSSGEPPSPPDSPVKQSAWV